MTGPVEIATRAWLQQWRLEWMKIAPDVPCPVPIFEELAQPDRMRMLRSIAAALRAADPKNVERYNEINRLDDNAAH